MENDITYFGKTNFRGQERVFGIKRDDRRRHTYVIGKTGMGKTTLLSNMIVSDINAGNGLAVVDPHGDLAEEILDFIPSSRINDVVYFNPADIDFPIAFNVMEHVDVKYRHLVASGLIGVFKKIWADSWGPRLEYLLRNTILGLLEYPDSTLLGVPRMLVDAEYRKKVVAKISDPVVKTFWTDEFTKYSKQFTVEAISPIQNKVGQFLSSALVRNIVSQPHSSIDMRDIMDNRKIFIINLAKGRIGEDYSALLGAMLITKLQLAAMERVDIAESERKDFYLYVDEFQNFATESFAGILSEARKYRLSLILAHQYIGQLDEEVRDAIFGNVGTLISFRVGAADAEFLEKEMEPIFYMNDLVNLAKYDMYLKLMIDGVSGDAFSASSLPPSQSLGKSNAEKIIKVSRERYTKKREVVEDKVARWSGYIKDKENGNLNENEIVKKEKDVSLSAKNNKDLWDAVCALCGKSIQVPFKPDPNRETYCKDCLVKVRKKLADSLKDKENKEMVKEKIEFQDVDMSKNEDKNEDSVVEKMQNKEFSNFNKSRDAVKEKQEISKEEKVVSESKVVRDMDVIKNQSPVDDKKESLIEENRNQKEIIEDDLSDNRVEQKVFTDNLSKLSTDQNKKTDSLKNNINHGSVNNIKRKEDFVKDDNLKEIKEGEIISFDN